MKIQAIQSDDVIRNFKTTTAVLKRLDSKTKLHH